MLAAFVSCLYLTKCWQCSKYSLQCKIMKSVVSMDVLLYTQTDTVYYIYC